MNGRCISSKTAADYLSLLPILSSCSNLCVFCFVHQRNSREIYIKDGKESMYWWDEKIPDLVADPILTIIFKTVTSIRRRRWWRELCSAKYVRGPWIMTSVYKMLKLKTKMMIMSILTTAPETVGSNNPVKSINTIIIQFWKFWILFKIQATA